MCVCINVYLKHAGIAKNFSTHDLFLRLAYTCMCKYTYMYIYIYICKHA